MYAVIFGTIALCLLCLRAIRSQEDTYYLNLSDARSFKQDLESIQFKHVNRSLKTILVSFDHMVILRESVNVTRFNNGTGFSIALNLFAVQGFAVLMQASPILQISPDYMVMDLTLAYSNLNMFDHNNKRLGESCDEYVMSFYQISESSEEFETRPDVKQLVDHFVGVFSFRIYRMRLQSSVGHNARLCPLVFRHARIWELIVDLSQTNHLVQNTLRFSSMNQAPFAAVDLNCTIKNYILQQLYRPNIDAELLSPVVLNNTQAIQLSGTFDRFSDDSFFKSFPRLKALMLIQTNMREFLHASDNKWLLSLNAHLDSDVDLNLWNSGDFSVTVKLEQDAFFLVLEILQYDYDFPDEDFCLFKHFPHRRLVMPVLVTQNLTYEPTCTVSFLIQYVRFVDTQAVRILQGKDSSFFYNPNKSELCNLDQRLKECESVSYFQLRISVNETQQNVYDVIYRLKWLELMDSVIAKSILAFAGFLTNLLIVLVIWNKTNQTMYLEHNRIFTYIGMNSVFNLIECLIIVLTLLNECLGISSIYCSSVMHSHFVQYFKIYVINFGGESMRTCSILTLLAFSYERYIITIDCKRKWASAIKSMRLRVFFVGIMLFSFLISANKIFEYAVNDDSDPESIFCSTVMHSHLVQNFKIFVVEYFGESMKTCSIINLLAFSLERYIATVDCKSKLANAFRTLNLKLFCSGTIIFSLLISVNKIYEYAVYDESLSISEYPTLNIDIALKETWYKTIYIIHYLFTDVIFFLANMIIDILLVRHLRQEMTTKRKLQAKYLEKPKAIADSSSPRETRAKGKPSDLKKLESNTNKMIVYAFLVYFFCRLPELFYYAHLLFVGNQFKVGSYAFYCIRLRFCVNISTLVQYLYLISYSVNVWFYYKFNKPFRTAFKRMLKIKEAKK